MIKKRSIGIDISDLSVKAVVLEKNGKEINFIFFKKFELLKGAVEKGDIKNEQEVVGAVQKVFQSLKQEKKIKVKKIAVSLPEEKSFVDIIKLPVLKETDKIASIVSFEAENVIPFPLADVYFDFEKIETTAKIAKCQEVILSACPKKIVDGYLKIFQKIDKTPCVMEVESFSVARAITEKNFFYSPFLLVDFGLTRTTLAIFAGKNLRFTCTICPSSEQLTKSIASFFGVSESAGEEIKKKEGLLGKKDVFEAAIPFLHDMVGQIKHYIDYYKTHWPKCQEFSSANSLKKILLCGEGANLKGLAEFLSEELSIEVEKADCLVNIGQKKMLQKLEKEDFLGFATAIGLALKALD